MTSLFSRLQKLNKEATPGPWRKGAPDIRCVKHERRYHPRTPECQDVQVGWSDGPDIWRERESSYTRAEYKASEGLVAGMWDYEYGGIQRTEDAALIVECRNSLPAVLNLIEAARELEEFCGGVPQSEIPPELTLMLWRLSEKLAPLVSGQEEPR